MPRCHLSPWYTPHFFLTFLGLIFVFFSPSIVLRSLLLVITLDFWSQLSCSEGAGIEVLVMFVFVLLTQIQEFGEALLASRFLWTMRSKGKHGWMLRRARRMLRRGLPVKESGGKNRYRPNPTNEIFSFTSPSNSPLHPSPALWSTQGGWYIRKSAPNCTAWDHG